MLLWMFVLCLAYLCLWPVPVEPHSWSAPSAPGYIGDFETNEALGDLELLPLGDNHGPEAVAINARGDIYVATHEGWIMRRSDQNPEFSEWINTEGRPLGIGFDHAGNLWIADAFRGLLRATPEGELHVVKSSHDNRPLLYVNDLDIGNDGIVYFTDSSDKHSAKAQQSTLKASLLDILEHGGRGRLFAYNPLTQSSKVLMLGLNFANGVAIDPNNQFVLVSETGAYRVHKVWLQGDRKGEHEVLLDNLPGFPDNLSRGREGRFWVGFTSPRNTLVDKLSAKPFLRKVVQRLPAAIRPKAVSYAHVLAFNAKGKVLQSLQDPSGRYPLSTGAAETASHLYISSLVSKQLGRLAMPVDE